MKWKEVFSTNLNGKLKREEVECLMNLTNIRARVFEERLEACLRVIKYNYGTYASDIISGES